MERLITKEYIYSNAFVEYIPSGWVKIDNRWYPLGFKVVRLNQTSLRLRKNPTPLYYPLGKWVKLKGSELIPTEADAGGIWSGPNLSQARKTQETCRARKNEPFESRIYYAAIYNPIFLNNYRVKSQGIMLLEELL